MNYVAEVSCLARSYKGCITIIFQVTKKATEELYKIQEFLNILKNEKIIWHGHSQ